MYKDKLVEILDESLEGLQGTLSMKYDTSFGKVRYVKWLDTFISFMGDLGWEDTVVRDVGCGIVLNMYKYSDTGWVKLELDVLNTDLRDSVLDIIVGVCDNESAEQDCYGDLLFSIVGTKLLCGYDI